MNTATIVQKLWNYCNVLRDDGMSYGDYVEQLALTLALSQRERGKRGEMADERSRPPYNQASPVLAGYDWQRLPPSLALPRKRERGFSWGDELFDHYRHTLEELGKQKGFQ
jgi:type I restriction enzyme M protein